MFTEVEICQEITGNAARKAAVRQARKAPPKTTPSKVAKSGMLVRRTARNTVALRKGTADRPAQDDVKKRRRKNALGKKLILSGVNYSVSPGTSVMPLS